MRLLEPTLSPVDAARLGPVVTNAIQRFRSPAMAEGLNYALLPDLRATTSPFGYASLDALARRIHRDRKGEVLQLTPAKARFRDHVRDVTKLTAEHPQSGRVRLIGFAWTAGRPAEALQAALDRAEPATGVWAA